MKNCKWKTTEKANSITVKDVYQQQPIMKMGWKCGRIYGSSCYMLYLAI